MIDHPRISIITATYNSVSTLGDCLASLRDQTWPNIESIVIDGGSSDGTQALLQTRFGNVVNRLISEPDQGIYDALNKGLRAARGDVVGFLHSDDVLASPDVLARVAQAFADPAVQAVYGDLVYVRRARPAQVVRLWRSQPFHPGLLRKGWMPPHPTLYLRRELLMRLGGFDLGYRIAADYEHVLRVFSTPGLVSTYLPTVMVCMKTGGASNRSLRNMLLKSSEDLRAIRHHRLGGLGTLLRKNLGKIGQFRMGTSADSFSGQKGSSSHA